jgi:glycosyltransferase involved in cell wall biosynthesis
MKNKPIISILVPIYNAEKYLGKCLESIISQSYKNLEIILVDDGSTDNSLAICKGYAESDSRIKWFTQLNKGIIETRNVLMSKITGQFFAFIDADDFFEPNAIEILLTLILENDADLARGSFRSVDLESAEIEPHMVSSKLFNNYEYMEFMLKGNWTMWANLYRFNKKYIQKIEVDNRALNIEKAISSDQIIYNYRKGHESIMNTSDSKRFLSESFLTFFYTFKELRPYLKYEDLLINGITHAIYNYVYFFNKNIHHDELQQMTRFLFERKRKVRGGQIKFMLSTLKLSYNLSHLSVFLLQKIKPTIKTFNSSIDRK